MRKFIQNCSYPLQINKNQPLTNINCYILYKNHVYNTLCIKYLLVQGKVKMTIKTSFGLKKLPQARFVNLFSKRRYPINVAKILQTYSMCTLIPGVYTNKYVPSIRVQCNTFVKKCF
jgi:hypothetical protein